MKYPSGKGYLKMILATDDDHGIGKDNKLPWHCKTDLAIFKEKTLDTFIIMGHNTAKSLPNGKPLLNRTNIVLCRELPENPVHGFLYFHSVEDILEFVEGEKAWVIGGAEIYRLFIDECEEIHETNIAGNFNCDTKFVVHKEIGHQVRSKSVSLVDGMSISMVQSVLSDSITIWRKK